jgi:hypothetical protein
MVEPHTPSDSEQPQNRPLLDRPYAARQLIVVVDDAAVEEAKRKQPSKEGASKDHAALLLGTAASVVGVAASVIAPFPVGIIVSVVAELARGLTRLREEGVQVSVISQSEAVGLRFPPGHPRHNVLYVGHPADPKVYFTTAQFHRLTFEHKFAEAVHLLMALGATTLEVQHIAGWSSEFSSKLGVALPPADVEAGLDASRSKKSGSQLLFTASLEGSKSPSVPDNLVWYHHEPTWQRIADGRLSYGLKDFTLTVSYEDDFGINAGLKLKAGKVGLDLGGQFEDHQSTVWRIVGKFS